MNRRRNLVGRYVGLVVLALLFLAPVYWLVATALKRPSELGSTDVSLLPAAPQWHNFTDAFSHIDFLAYARNSMVIALITAVLSTLSSAYIGFGLARLRARGRGLVFGLLLSTLMLPTIVTVIPTYILFSKVRMVDTYWPWVLWGLAGSAYLVFLFRQAFLGIPTELEDAALIDGAGYLRMWWRIFLPNTKAVIAASFVLSFVAAWGDYITPKLFLRQDTTTLAVAVTTGYIDQSGRTINTLLAAGSIMFAVPVIVIFFVLQRYFVQGFATSGLK